MKNQFLHTGLLALLILMGGCRLNKNESQLKSTATSTTDLGCEGCHSQAHDYLSSESLHVKRGIKCGQCHILEKTTSGFPAPLHPAVRKTYVSDKTCGQCHNEQYSQILESEIYKNARVVENLEDISVRRSERGDGTKARYTKDNKFTQNQLCTTCHFSDHQFVRIDKRLAISSLVEEEFVDEQGVSLRVISHKIKENSVIIR